MVLRRSESMKKHGWTTQEGQTTDKGKPVAVPPEPRPLRFQRSRRRRRKQKSAVASSDLHIMQEDWGPHYDESMWWQQWWLQIHGTTGEDWPEGEGKMYHSNLLCVPENLSGRVIRAHHEMAGHITG